MTQGASTTGLRDNFGLQVLIGLAIGLALGFVARGLGEGNALAEALRTVGGIFVQLLKVLVPPIVVTAIIASVAALRDLNNAGRLVAATLGWFAITAFAAVLIGIALGIVLEPGLRAGVDPALAKAPAAAGSWLDFLKGVVPGNTLGLTASTSL
jgi:Na+/H+-dicarboxylate symporter